MRRATLAVSMAMVGAGVLVLPSSALARFAGDVCALPTGSQLTAAHVGGACTRKRSTRSEHTPLGALTQEAFIGQWGQRTGEPIHSLTVSVTRIRGGSAVLAAARSKLRLQIISEGAPVAVGSVASWHGSTSSCVNPPTDDCTGVQVTAIVKHFVITVLLFDYPTGGNAEQSGDDGEDLAQEEADKVPAVAIARTVASRL